MTPIVSNCCSVPPLSPDHVTLTREDGVSTFTGYCQKCGHACVFVEMPEEKKH